MRNKNLMQVLGITILTIILLTWIIPASNFDGYGVTKGLISPTGIWDIFGAVGIAIAYFWQAGLFVLFVGGLYGVINKTGALKSLVDDTKKRFKGNEKLFLIVSVTFFMLIASLTGIYFPLFAFVPLFAAVILSMGYSKLLALLCTIGAIIIGNMSVMYNDIIDSTLRLQNFPNIWYRLALFILTLALIIVYVWKAAEIKKGRKSEKVSEAIMFMDEETEKKVSTKIWPLATTFAGVFILFVLGMTRWTELFKLEIFQKMHESVMGVKIGNFHIFRNILGQTVVPFGKWGMPELFVIVFLATVLVAILYKLNFKDMLEGFKDGVNKLLPTAALVVLINIVVIFTLNSGFYTTILNYLITLTSNLNVITMSINIFIGSILVVDTVYVSNYILSITTGLVSAEASMPLIALITQTMYGMAMLIAPTSLVLIAGLSYLNVPYTSWAKYIWRLLLMLLVIVVIILTAATLIK